MIPCRSATTEVVGGQQLSIWKTPVAHLVLSTKRDDLIRAIKKGVSAIVVEPTHFPARDRIPNSDRLGSSCRKYILLVWRKPTASDGVNESAKGVQH